MAEAPHVMIVEARFYQDLADELSQGAIAELEKAGASWERFAVPGAFEIPAAILYALRARDLSRLQRPFDGFVALGCVIRGETSHYDLVCGECAHGLQALSLEHDLALGFGVLTCENREQAWARASRSGRNKGAEAARACLVMIELKRGFGLEPC
ncbi:MAG TPA: 6,7-dimethyl-8-ribityllumazine synthase [Alphaproteobacteria bacterium]|nr:6,7-dimethyl-8-ribityllumazine synthase [Alphaproteobacteria bacterium]